MTDLVTELIKVNMGEQNITDDGGISLKYGLVVAFARKPWKLQPSIGRYVKIRPISEARLTIIQKNNPRTHRTQHCPQYSCVEIKRLHAYTKQYTESYVQIYMWKKLLQIFILIKVLTETEEICWFMECNVCAEDYTFLWKNTLYIKDRIFYTSEYCVSN